MPRKSKQMVVDVSLTQETPAIVVTPPDAPPAGTPENPASPSNPNPNTAPNPATPPNLPPYPQNPTPEQPPAAPESFTNLPVAAQAPQLVPSAPKRTKRYTGPKEFSVALKAAENRLAKALTERAEFAGKLAAVNAEIPSLMGIIQALRGPSNYPVQHPPQYDPYANVHNLQAPFTQQFTAPVMTPYMPPANALAAIQSAIPSAPVSRAQGGAMQFSPDMVGKLEGPEDDEDIDRFITGPAAGGSGWIGG